MASLLSACFPVTHARFAGACRLLLGVVLVAGLAAPAGAQEPAEGLRAGAAKVDVTPRAEEGAPTPQAVLDPL